MWLLSLMLVLAIIRNDASIATSKYVKKNPLCCDSLPWKSNWVCPGCPGNCSICHGSGSRSGPTQRCSDIKWGKNWECHDCPLICTIPQNPIIPILHPFSQTGAGDVNGPFELNGTFHLFTCCSWNHLTSRSPIGPWTSIGGSIGSGYISGSVTVVSGVPRIVAPINRGNNNHCCEGPPSNKTWRYPCVANPPTQNCYQDYMMSLPTNVTDLNFKSWQQFDNQIMIVSHTDGHNGHGWVQQDPSRGWRDPQKPNDWLFLGGTSINGNLSHPDGEPIIEIFRSKAGNDWSKGFEYSGVFSDDGLQMCDPELIPFGNVSALYVCNNHYLLGTIVSTENVYHLEPLVAIPFGGKYFEGGRTSAAKGFLHNESGRYLLWLTIHTTHGGFTLVREVTIDHDLSILLSYPVHEYEELRREKQVNISGVSNTVANQAMMTAKGASQIDLKLLFKWTTLEGPSGGEVIGASVLDGSMNILVCFINSSVAHLVIKEASQGKPLLCSSDSMAILIKSTDISLALRIVVDGPIIEAFAQHGRAQFVAAAKSIGTPLMTHVALLVNGTEKWKVNAEMWRLAY